MTTASELQVREYTGPAAEWDRFVEQMPGRTHFHRHGWRDVIKRALGHEAPYLAAIDATGALQGVLPLVSLRTMLFGRYLVSMPFVNYGGPLGTPNAVTALGRAAVAMAGRLGVKLLELRSRVELPLDLAVSHRKITVVMDIPDGGSEALFASFKAKLRSQIRKPQKEGVSVRFGPDQVEPFYRVFAQHMRDLGTPVQSRRLFDEIVATFPDTSWFGCAWYNGVPVAGGAGFVWGNEFEMTWASALDAYSRVAPNMLLYWAFMERAATAGLTLFNFGRCTPGSGTHRFKQQWGSRDETLWWYTQSRGSVERPPSQDEGLFRLASRAWQRLPVPVATVLGPRIVRGIP